MPPLSLSRSWIPAGHRCCRLSSTSSSSRRRLSSSEILAAESTASCTDNEAAGGTTGATLGRFLSEHAFPISKSGLGTASTNTGPRPDSSGTGILRIVRSIHNWAGERARRPCSGTADRCSGLGHALHTGSTTTATRMNSEGRNTPALDHTQPGDTGADPGFKPSSTVILKGVGTTLLDADIRDLVPQKKHIPAFRDKHDILQVIQYRNIKSLDRRPIYHILFPSPAAAFSFIDFAIPEFLVSKRAEWPDVRFPPACKPEFSVADVRATSLQQQHVTLSNILRGENEEPAHCVLLTICGLGGKTKSTGKLPRSDDIKAILENLEIKLCGDRDEKPGRGLQRILQEIPGGKKIAKADGRGLGAEGRWLIRCQTESEAHRVVRELHKKEAWKGSGKFRAEMIY